MLFMQNDQKGRVMIGIKNKLKLFSVCVFLVFWACGTGPSHDEIKLAVQKSLEKRVPISLAKHLTGGEDAVVLEVKVIKIGRAQGSGENKYWPVIIYARGTCVKMFGGRQPFEGQAEYYVRKNAYGEWVAEPKGF